MRIATVISLGASALLGVGALVVARVWMPSGAAAPSTTAEPAGVPVVVATAPLGYGVKLEPKHLAVVRFPANSAPEGSFSTIQQVLEQDGGAPVVIVPLAPREPLLPAKLTGPGARPTIASLITDGMRAYTVRVNDIGGVGGHALPGDRVDVLLMRDLSTDGSPRLVTDVVLQHVRLLGIDLNADPTSTTPAPPQSATVEVSVEDAQKLAMAANLGSLSLALRRTGAADTEIMRPILATELGIVGATVRKGGGGAAAAAPAPVQASAAPAGRPAAARVTGRGRTVVVVHGDASTVVEVPVSGAGA
jgi:pilus assembly protein CpaB